MEAIPVELSIYYSTPAIFRDLITPIYTCRQIYAETRLLPYRYNKFTAIYPPYSMKWLDHFDEVSRTAVWNTLLEEDIEKLMKSGYKLPK